MMILVSSLHLSVYLIVEIALLRLSGKRHCTNLLSIPAYTSSISAACPAAEPTTPSSFPIPHPSDIPSIAFFSPVVRVSPAADDEGCGDSEAKEWSRKPGPTLAASAVERGRDDAGTDQERSGNKSVNDEKEEVVRANVTLLLI
ncbi:hypothetical protein GUJ93_ZPchr0013g34731 [Zizania palustris]|uniref:Uncharacterized protein n=1 Tax=Zizania palustris TaxID=103762 RepID=A0A8J6C512_ZIZPA|nr:hypothetical protein GUJ93_ZPchr0013g34731 [Zizania palustris]